MEKVATLHLKDIKAFIQQHLLKSITPDRLTLMSILNEEELKTLEGSGKILTDLKEITALCQSKL